MYENTFTVLLNQTLAATSVDFSHFEAASSVTTTVERNKTASQTERMASGQMDLPKGSLVQAENIKIPRPSGTTTREPY